MRVIESLTDMGIRLKEERKKRKELPNENRSEKDFVCKRGHDIVSVEDAPRSESMSFLKYRFLSLFWKI